MPRISSYPSAASAAATDELVANQAGTTRKLTVAQLRAAMQPADSDLAALAAIATTGLVRRNGPDNFTAGPVAPADIAQGGAASGQVLKWNGAAWAPAADATGAGGGGSFSGDFAGAAATNVLTALSDTAATAITLAAGQSGATLRTSASGTVSVTLPATLPVGFSVTFLQGGAGQVVFAPGTGAALASRQAHTRTAGQHALATVLVAQNSGGNAAQWVLAGDTTG